MKLSLLFPLSIHINKEITRNVCLKLDHAKKKPISGSNHWIFLFQEYTSYVIYLNNSQRKHLN